MSEQPKKPFLNSSDEVSSDETDAATKLAEQAGVTGTNTDSIAASPQTPAQPALKLAAPRAATPAAPATPTAPRPAAEPTPTPTPTAAIPRPTATPTPTAAIPRPTAAPTPAAARSAAIPLRASTEEATISVPMLIIDAIAAAVAIAFTVLLLQDLSPFLN
jgi:hypothetical protein